jgi:hypothetical protein
MLPHEIVQVRASDFFLALHHKLEAERQFAQKGERGFDRGESQKEVPLIIGGAARINFASAKRGLKRRAFPEFQRLWGLNIVVVIDEKRAAIRVSHFAVNDGRTSLDGKQA